MNDEWLTRELRATIRCHQALLHATDEQELLDDICRIICEDAGYALAWVGYAVHDELKSVRPVAFAGNEDGYLSEFQISWGDGELGNCPAGVAIRTGSPHSIDDFATDPTVVIWAASAGRRGFVGCMGLPLVGDNGVAFGALTVYASGNRRFDADEQELLEGLAADLAFGIRALRRRAAARRQNELFKAAWETSPDAMMITSVAEGTIADVNQGFEELLGWSKGEALGKNVEDIRFWVNPGDRDELLKTLARDGVARHQVKLFGRSDGTEFIGDISSRIINIDNGTHLLSVLRDVTGEYEAERELKARHEMLTQAQRIARLGHYVFEPMKDQWSSSPALNEMFGIEESYRRDVAGWLGIIHPGDRARMADYVSEHVIRQGRPFDAHYRIVRVVDGAELMVHGLGELEFDDDGNVSRMFGVIQDVSDRVRVQQQLQESEARYKSISETVTSFVYSCVREPGKPHRVDWIAGAVEALSGYPKELLMQRGCWRFAIDPEDGALFDENVCHLSSGQAATVDLRLLRADGSRRWVRSSASASPVSEIPGAVRIVGSVEDITEKRQAESDLVTTNARLEGVLKSLTETMAKVVEARDPYTEGHERGVARIARQIAQRMGMPPCEIEGIEVAANLHDVGKLAIPAEILSKPSKLSDIEYEFVKQHATAGFDILRGIDFDWPVAEMTLQHHERMDGTGYPSGLSGDEILPGARVIMVADVIDAMSAHRPYRPSLGIEAAIAEVKANPTKFDAAVVEALLSLYEEGSLELHA